MPSPHRWFFPGCRQLSLPQPPSSLSAQPTRCTLHCDSSIRWREFSVQPFACRWQQECPRNRMSLLWPSILFSYKNILYLLVSYCFFFSVLPQCVNAKRKSGSETPSFRSNIDHRGATEQITEQCTRTYCEGNLSNPDMVQIIRRNIGKLSLFNQRGKEPTSQSLESRRIAHLANGDACRSQTFTIRPTSALTANDEKFRAILNSEEFVQYEQIEVCQNENGRCSNVHTDQGYRAYCKQTYAHRKFISYNETSRQPELVTFLLESGCSCYVGKA